jgi:hypothetical protein
MFDVYVFKEGDDERPANKIEKGEFKVNDSFGVRYPSKEYIFAFHPSSVLVFVIVDESRIVMILELFRGFETKLNVPFPMIPAEPCDPVLPS